MADALRQALDNLYDVLARPRPLRIDGCPCCVDRKTRDALHAVPLRDLTAEDLSNYATSVFLTVGEVADYLYYLPRILDISAHDEGWWPSMEIVIGGLGRGGWLTWPAAYQRAVRAVLEAWFEQCAASAETLSEDDQSLDSFLCGIARAGLDPTNYIDRLAAERPYALCVFWEQNRATLAKKDRMDNAFWSDVPDWAAKTAARLRAADVQAIVA